jgi:fumagillin biosynthesis dioxygenase
MGSTNDLYDAARLHLKEEGWAVIRSVLSKSEAQSILDRLWKEKADLETAGSRTFMPEIDPNEHNVRIFNLIEIDQVFRDLISHPLALDMVESAIGPGFLMSNFTANIARPGSQSMSLHSDQSIVVPDPWTRIWAINVIWCLTDVRKDNGATLFIPGSNKWTTRAEIPENAPELLRPFEAKAGDIILMDGRLWHTSGQNVTENEDRALLFGYYTASFLRQQVNWTAKLTREFQEKLSEEMTDLLGLRAQANTRRTGDMRYISQQYPGVKVG